MKKTLSLLLIGVFAVAMGMGTAAASGYRYVEMTERLGYIYKGPGSLNDDICDLDEIYAYDEVEVELGLVSEMFAVAAGDTQPAAGDTLSAADIRSSKIAVRSQARAGSKAIEDVSIDTRKGAVIVKFVDEWVSTEEQDFEVYVYLTIDGMRQDDYGLTLTGTMTNPVIEVYENFDAVDIGEGYVADAKEFVENIEVDLGEGVSVFTKFFKGKKYYGTASRKPDEAADVVMKRYPDIDNVIILKTVGLNSTGDVVKLSTDYSNYYVYDNNLQYIGQSDEPLPSSPIYYLANQKLNVVGAEEPELAQDDSKPGTETAPGSNAGGNASSNANANPSTGR